MMRLLEVLLTVSLCSAHSTLYRASRNISTTNFYSMVTKTVKMSEELACAHSCLYWEAREEICNSYSYEKLSTDCHLAKLSFLEDPMPGESSQSIMVDVRSLDELEMRCRGGEGCCVRNDVRLCSAGEGDCDKDSDCDVGLVCGDNNCNQQGGLWDSEDDCCEPRCLASRPCEEGDGGCTEDAACKDSHFFFCGTNNCHTSDLMSTDYYQRNLLLLSSSSRCCVRRCHSSHQCGHGQIGCIQDGDCQHGLYCDTSGGELQGFCKYKCFSEERCVEGEGPCRGDNNACMDSHLYICGHDTCTNTNIFPTDLFPNNSVEYEWHDDCCVRRCHHGYSRCSEGEFGCVEDRDCSTGLRCNRDTGDPEGFCEKTYCTYMGVKEYPMSWHYHDGKCYGFRDRSDSWGGSQAYCRSMGASLAKMESEEEMEFIRDMWGGHTFWLGARDRITEGVWEWYDGSPVSWTYWGGSNPDGGTSENCLAWSGGGNQYWNSQRCYYSRYSVCSINDCHGREDQEDCCSPSSPCGLWGGDCDTDADCVGDLLCGSDNCHLIFPGSPTTTDCCVAFCRGSGSEYNCCTDEEPCDRTYGDCDGDGDCAGSLTCGDNNCVDHWGSVADPDYDCCQ